jgi:hypothetical protein
MRELIMGVPDETVRLLLIVIKFIFEKHIHIEDCISVGSRMYLSSIAKNKLMAMYSVLSISTKRRYGGKPPRVFLASSSDRLPALPEEDRLIRPPVCPSPHTCRLGIEREMAQAQQIRSILLQNHEST